MNFGEKLFKLRKERGLSQEALAEKVGTSRQAISKWENNQGYPETEKLLILSNILEVSTDFLLKEESSVNNNDERGYYVNRELAQGYLRYSKKVNQHIGLCFMFWALAGVPYTVFPAETHWRIIGIALCIVLGIITIIPCLFMEVDKYKILEQEPLIFDYNFLKELSDEYRHVKRRCKMIAIPCTFLFVIGLLILGITMRDVLAWTEYHSLVFLGIAIGILGFVLSIGMMEAYELLIKNEQYCQRTWFKLKRKIRNKIENI